MPTSCPGLPGAFAPFIPIAIQTPNNSGRTADQPGIQVSHRFSTNSGAAIALSFTIRMRLMDTLTKRERSERMSRVRGKDTGPELAVRKLAHSMGYRYRLHVRDLPGAPDLVFPRLRKIILVHGCFWHRHANCKLARLPKSRLEFWLPKLNGNHTRDLENVRALRKNGWKVKIIWECQINRIAQLRKSLSSFLADQA